MKRRDREAGRTQFAAFFPVAKPSAGERLPPHGSTGGYSTVRDDRYATGEGVANGVSWSRKGFGKKSGAARGGVRGQVGSAS